MSEDIIIIEKVCKSFHGEKILKILVIVCSQGRYMV